MIIRIVSVIFFILPLISFADSHSPTPFCAEPTKPLLFSPAYYKDRYNMDVLNYKTCLMDFIAEQEKAVKLHKHAADTALQIWNDFVQKSR